jgi:L-ascorbate metabolism protein UlaG (beta-lactamase superfamily)
MKVTFLGNTTLHVSDGETSILIDGFMSRCPLEEAFYPAGSEFKCKVRPSRIFDYLSQGRITGIDVIVVGHSHYDHALDFSYIATNIQPEAKILGSRSTKMIGLGAGLDESRFFPVVDQIPAIVQTGRFTIKMIKSVHANPWVYRGEIESPTPFCGLNDPDHGVIAEDMKDGGVYTIIITHNGANGDSRSMLVQNTAGYSPNLPPLSDRVDAVFMTVSGLGTPEQNYRENNYRNLVENTGARLVVPIHWDNFFADLNDILNDRATDPYLFSDNIPQALNWVLERTKAANHGIWFYHQKFFESIDLYQDIVTYDPSRINNLWINESCREDVR